MDGDGGGEKREEGRLGGSRLQQGTRNESLHGGGLAPGFGEGVGERRK